MKLSVGVDGLFLVEIYAVAYQFRFEHRSMSIHHIIIARRAGYGDGLHRRMAVILRVARQQRGKHAWLVGSLAFLLRKNDVDFARALRGHVEDKGQFVRLQVAV